MQTKAMSTGRSLANYCNSVRWMARTGTVNSGTSFRCVMRRPRAHRLDMLGPGVDEGHVLAGLHHMRAGISADRAGADDRYLVAQDFHPTLGV